MATILFLADFDYTADDNDLTIAYLAGTEVEVDEECAEAAFLAGRALYVIGDNDDLDDLPEGGELIDADELRARLTAPDEGEDG